MKIKSITIENFRGYKNFTEEFTSDSNIILIYGKNGYGKTSLFDSIEWCLTGDIKRIEEKDDNKKAFKNINSAHEGKVQIIFQDGTIIERVINTHNQSILKQPTSEEEVKNYLFMKGVSEEKLNDLFNFSYLLSQDLISDFIKAINPKERYSILAKLLGLSNEYSLLDTLDEEQKILKNIIKEKEKNLNNLSEKLKIYSDDLKIEMINDKIDSQVIYHELKNLNIKEIEKVLKKEIEELSNIEKETLKYNSISLILKKDNEFKEREQKIIDIKNRSKILDAMYLKTEIKEFNIKKIKLTLIMKADLSTMQLDNFDELDLNNKKNEYLKNIQILSNSKENFRQLEDIFKDNKLFLKTLVEYESQFKSFELLEKTNKNLQNARNLYEGLTTKLYNAVNDFIHNKKEINACPLCNNIIENKEEFKKLLEKNLNINSNIELKTINDNYSSNLNLINELIQKIKENKEILNEEIKKEILKFEKKIEKIESILNNNIKIKKIDLDIKTKVKDLQFENSINLSENNSSLKEIEMEKNYLNEELIKLESKEYNEYILYSNKYNITQTEKQIIDLNLCHEKIKNKISELEELKKYLLKN